MIHIPRTELEGSLDAAALGTGAVHTLLLGPRGIGKTTLLQRLGERAREGGSALPVFLDLERAGYSPEALLLNLFSALDRSCLGGEGVALLQGKPLRHETPGKNAAPLNRCGEAIVRHFSGDRPDARRLLGLLAEIPGALAATTGRPVLLLLDEAHALARLHSYPATRGFPPRFLAALVRPPRVRIVAASSLPHPAKTLMEAALGGTLTIRVIPGLEVEALARAAAPAVLVETCRYLSGRPSYLLAIEETLARLGEADLGQTLEVALAEPDGALYRECRYDYELGIERARGYGVVKSAFAVLAREDGQNLTGVARYLKKSIASARDYLLWLQEVGLVRLEGRRWFHADRLLRLWTLLYAAGPPLSPIARTTVIASFLGEASGGGVLPRSRIEPPAWIPSLPAPEVILERAEGEDRHPPPRFLGRDADAVLERASDEAAHPVPRKRRVRRPARRPPRPRAPDSLVEID